MDLLLLRLLLVLIFAQQAAQVPEDRIDFDLLSETHLDLYNKSTPPYDPSDVQGRFILGERRPTFYSEPLRWIMLHVRIGQEAETTLALAHDDLYLLGFNNSAGNWYKLEGKRGEFQGLPGSTILPIKENYGDLLGHLGEPGAHKYLSTVPLGKQSAMEAVRKLAGYNLPGGMITENDVRQAMVRFVVMVCEAMRFTAIREKFSGRWEEETRIGEKEASYVVYWGPLSYMLVKWARGRGWQGENVRTLRRVIQVGGPSDALAIIDFLSRPRPPVDAPPPLPLNSKNKLASGLYI